MGRRKGEGGEIWKWNKDDFSAIDGFGDFDV